MKKYFILLIFTFQFFGLAQTPQVVEEKVEVILGIDKILNLSFNPLTRADIADPSVIGITFIPQKGEITLKGKKPGRSSILIRDRQGNLRVKYLVNVTATEKSKILRELQELLGDVEGLKIGLKGNKVFVGGKILVPGDIGKVVVILQDYKDVLNLVEVSPQTYQIIAQRMQEGMRKNNLKDVTVRFFNNSYLLEGVVTSTFENDLAQKIALAYLPDRIESLARRLNVVQSVDGQQLIKNFLVISEKKPPPPVEKLIKITAQFVELTKDYSRVFGFQWNPTLGGDGGSISFRRNTDGGVGTSSSNDTLSGTISGLFPKLSSAKAAGYARIVQSGVVIAKNNGAEVQLFKKSSRTTSVGSGDVQVPQTINAGFDLKVTPSILQEENINLAISLSVQADQGGTSSVENKVTTEIIVKNKESAVVGGISINKATTDYDRDPPGGDETVEDGQTLFNFLRSKSVQKSKEQFVVFVTPEIVTSASEGTEEIKRKFRKRGP